MYVCINQYGYMRVKWIKKSEQCSGKRGQWQGWKGSGLHRRQRAATLTQANYFQTLSEIKTKGSHTDTGKLYIQTLSEIKTKGSHSDTGKLLSNIVRNQDKGQPH